MKQILFGILLCFGLFTVTNSQMNFDFSAVFNCEPDARTANGCTKWNLTMSVVQNIAGVPAQQLIATKTGLKRMTDL